MLLEVGTIVEGKVTGITGFGAFVSLPGGKSGMVHISEVANTYVSDIHQYLADGQTVKVKIIAVTPEGKINLSIKKAADPQPQDNRAPSQEPRRAFRRPDRPDSRPRPAQDGQFGYQGQAQRTQDVSFEDKLKQFMQESDSKISGSRIYEQQKRSPRRRKD